MKGKELEICCDASIKEFEDKRTFGCAGSVCINTGQEYYTLIPDTTNNRAELIAIYNSVVMAQRIITLNPNLYDSITIYSDSKNSVFGLREWMPNWLKKIDSNGILYRYDNKPVENQDLYTMIISYIVLNNLFIKFRHQKGHINYNKQKDLIKAAKIFKQSNGYDLVMDDIYKISFYNALVDENSRCKLFNVDESQYAVLNENNIQMARYVINEDYKTHIL